MVCIDINCDLGESFGAYRIGNDEQLLPLVSSVNIACGFHAGSPTVIRKTVDAALRAEVAIGAHPGFPDLEGFGRREMNMTGEQIYDMMLYQIAALDGMVRSRGGVLRHVKPHGALYNMAARNTEMASAVADAVRAFSPTLALIALSGSRLVAEGQRAGLTVWQEIFADRSYQSDGSLTPRGHQRAVIENPKYAVEQVAHAALHGEVKSVQGTLVKVQADTVCVHGDGQRAPLLVGSLRQHLASKNIQVKALSI